MKNLKPTVLVLLVLFGFASLAWAAEIHMAVEAGDLDKVKSILADNPEHLESRNSSNLTPLLLAAIHGHTDIVRFLIEKGANINAGDNEGSTALHNAAARGHKEIISFLSAEGAELSRGDDNGMTPLHFAAAYGRGECAELLLEKGADVNARELNGRTPLFFNARQGNMELCKRLIEKGAIVDVYNKFDRGPLLYAIWGGHKKIARLLITKGADVNKKDTTGYTPLHQICIDGTTDFAGLLIAEGADIKMTDSSGHSPIHLAAYYGHGDMVKSLVTLGAEVEICDPRGDTPLHGAAWNGDKKALAALLDKDAALNVENKDGRTPLDYALNAGHKEAAQMLKEGGAKPSTAKIKRIPTAPIPDVVGAGEIHPIKFTVLYDNYVADEGTKAEWGFSCLIEGTEKTILFDTGGNPATFMHNVNHLKADLRKVEKIVISHNHWDHIGGLPAVLEIQTEAPIYIPFEFPYDFVRKVETAKAEVVPVNEPVTVCNHVYLTGQMGRAIKEQSLILNTPKGLVIITGCSHQGIVNILKKAKEILQKDIYLVFGGFHLMAHSEERVNAIIQDFKKLGVIKCGATHCTGDRAIQQFKDAFGSDYVEIGSGRILYISDKGLH